jgi:integrase
MLALEDLQILVVLERAVLLGAHLTSGEGALAGAPVPALSGRPCSTAHLPRKTPVVSTPADLQALLSAFEDPALAAILELAALTGARRQEILALEWADVDLDGARLTVSEAVEESKRGIRVKETKSAAGARTIHLPQRAVAALRAHRKRQLELRVQLGAEWYCGDLVFPSYETGGVRRPRNVIKAVARARRRAGIAGGTLHGFRHGHATELLRAGVAPKARSLDRRGDYEHLQPRPAVDGPRRRRPDRARFRGRADREKAGEMNGSRIFC